MIFFFGEFFIIPSLVDFLYSPKARRTRQSLSDYPFCCKEFPWECLPLLCLTLTHFDLDNLMERFTLTLLPALFSSDGCVESESPEGHIMLIKGLMKTTTCSSHTLNECHAAEKLCSVCISSMQVQFSPQISGVQ